MGKVPGRVGGEGGDSGREGGEREGKWRGGVGFAGVHSELGGMINYRSERAGG